MSFRLTPPPANGDLRGLLRTLAAQRRALRKGEIEALPALERKLTTLADRLEQNPGDADPDLAAALGDEARRALQETGAALAGLRDAQALLAAARAPRNDVTYGPQGEKRALTAPAGQLERRT